MGPRELGRGSNRPPLPGTALSRRRGRLSCPSYCLMGGDTRRRYSPPPSAKEPICTERKRETDQSRSRDIEPGKNKIYF